MSEMPIHRLWELRDRPRLFGVQARDTEVVQLFGRLAETCEPRSIVTVVPFFLADASAEVRLAAAGALQQLFSRLPPEQILDVCDRIERDLAWEYFSPVQPWRNLQPSSLSELAADGPTRVVVLGYASFHHNGYVRHKALHLLAGIHDGSELPFLLIRQNDWVAPISSDAQVLVRDRLTNEYLPHFVANLWLVVHLLAFRRRDHSEIVRRIVSLLVQPQHDALLVQALHSPNRQVRRDIAQFALELPGVHVGRVVEHGLSSDDSAIRLWCARRIRTCVPAESIRGSLVTLKHDPFMPIRREAMLIEADTFPDAAIEVWNSGLLDPSSSLRELAQLKFAKLAETHPADFYRRAIAEHPNFLPALGGLCETGDQSDLQVIRNYLHSSASSLRAAAVRGISRIGGKPVVPELVELLGDDSSAVVRTVRKQLELTPQLPDGDRLVEIAKNDARPHVRRAVLRLLFEKGKWDGLPWLIQTSGHNDPVTAAHAQQLIERWFSPPLCNKIFTKPSDAQSKAITEALYESKTGIEKEFRIKLHRWLAQ